MQKFQDGFADLKTDEERNRHFMENRPQPEETAQAMITLSLSSVTTAGPCAIGPPCFSGDMRR